MSSTFRPMSPFSSFSESGIIFEVRSTRNRNTPSSGRSSTSPWPFPSPYLERSTEETATSIARARFNSSAVWPSATTQPVSPPLTLIGQENTIDADTTYAPSAAAVAIAAPRARPEATYGLGAYTPEETESPPSFPDTPRGVAGPLNRGVSAPLTPGGRPPRAPPMASNGNTPTTNTNRPSLMPYRMSSTADTDDPFDLELQELNGGDETIIPQNSSISAAPLINTPPPAPPIANLAPNPVPAAVAPPIAGPRTPKNSAQRELGG